MKQNFKPESYNSVSPYFVVDGAEKLIDLLVKIFEAEILRVYHRPDGSIMHAEIRIDDSVLMFGDSTDEYPPNKQLMHTYVADVDGVFERAIDFGCEPLEKPKQKKDDSDRRGGFKDFAGNVWYVATQVEEGS